MLGWQMFVEEHHDGKELPARWNSRTHYQLL